MKKAEEPKKLIDILRDVEKGLEGIALTSQSKQGYINTQQEILSIETQLDNQNMIIYKALVANPFSASKLYAARKEKVLLEMKLKGLQEILEELF